MTWLKTALYAIGAGLLATALLFIRQSGADAEKLKQAGKDAKAASTIGKARAEARGKSDTDLDSELEKWTRK